ncbi:hypothetical protein AW27_030050 [Streptomyces sp. PCS3-D2]|uniref:hypothetical protein n=1 Tax=Streptomyces sp. PCS3-D2 TaxID=1460244 RepID=UPI0004451F7E|nr:hypothetical protein [Streptomyces sp. PCS3-D2]WKV75396.1 hypothetical protein AW27_030050 [Streptomyces sp. PCS3-D2]
MKGKPMRRPLARIAQEALNSVSTAATDDTGPVVADVWTEDDLGFVLLVHRRDDGHFAEELFSSLRASDEDTGATEWADCDHLSGGLLGFDPTDPAAREEILARHAMAMVTESESLVHTGRVPEDDGDELVRAVELLVTPEADGLEVENLSRPSHHIRRLSFPLALVVLLPGDRLRIRAVRADGCGYTAVGTDLELEHPSGPAPDGRPSAVA